MVYEGLVPLVSGGESKKKVVALICEALVNKIAVSEGTLGSPVAEDVVKTVSQIAQSLLMIANVTTTTTDLAAMCHRVLSAKQGVMLLVSRALKQNPVWMDAVQKWSKTQMAWSQHGTALQDATTSVPSASLDQLKDAVKLLPQWQDSMGSSAFLRPARQNIDVAGEGRGACGVW